MNESTKPADKLIVNREFNCPVCGTTFSQYAVRKMKIRLVNSDIDLRSYFEPIDPLYYDVVLCKKCGYAADIIFFESIARQKKEAVIKEVTPNFVQRDYEVPYTPDTALILFHHALFSCEAKQGASSEFAYIYLKMAWIHRDMGNKEQEIIHLAKALEYFNQAYVDENFPICTMDNLTFRYMMGAINYLLGNHKDALRWIADVVVARDIPGRLKNRAVDLKELIRSQGIH